MWLNLVTVLSLASLSANDDSVAKKLVLRELFCFFINSLACKLTRKVTQYRGSASCYFPQVDVSHGLGRASGSVINIA